MYVTIEVYLRMAGMGLVAGIVLSAILLALAWTGRKRVVLLTLGVFLAGLAGLAWNWWNSCEGIRGSNPFCPYLAAQFEQMVARVGVPTASLTLVVTAVWVLRRSRSQ